MATWFDNQLSNKNFLSPIGFFSIGQDKDFFSMPKSQCANT